jgi:hypothetical protein
MGRLIMRLKQLADDYGLLVIVCAHPPKDGVEKRHSKNPLLTLNGAGGGQVERAAYRRAAAFVRRCA